MPPRKMTSTMMLVRKSKQPENMAKPETEKMKSPLLEELPHNSNTTSPSTKMTQSTTNDDTLSKQGWSLLPEELLLIISEKLEDCFHVIHARSVCQSWRSSIPFPSCLLRTSYSLPSFSNFRRRRNGKSRSCTLEKFPMFFFRVRAPLEVDGLPYKFFVGEINQDKSENHMELQSPLQCTVKVKIPESEPILLNVLDCQILHMGYQFRMVGWDPNSLEKSFRGVAFLPLDKEGGKEFVVLIGYSYDLWVLRSSEMRWMPLDWTSEADCSEIVAFRGKFYVNFLDSDVFVIDPYTLKATPILAPLMPSQSRGSVSSLVPCGNEELFLVERIIGIRAEVLDLGNLAYRVCRLDEDAGEWVVVTDLGDRVLLIGQPGNSSCSAKELPDGCGVSGNSFLFTHEFLSNIVYFYKYGVDTENAEDNQNLWRQSRETVVTFLNTWPMVAFRAESSMP